MTPKTALKKLIWLAAQMPVLRPAVVAYYDRDANRRPHPFDRVHGVHTSGMLPGFVLRSGEPMDSPHFVYGAAQPSIIRAALAAIPAPRDCHFIDIGCGKGRPLLVATEFGFREITGIEFSPTLSRIARRNAATFGRAYPDRTRIDIVTIDATAYQLPGDQLVLFLYNPFGQPLIGKLLHNIEAFLSRADRTLYIVYYNPTCAPLFDGSPLLERRYAAQLAYDPEEIGHGPDRSDAVVIWQNRGNVHPPRCAADHAVTIVVPGLRAEVVARD